MKAKTNNFPMKLESACFGESSPGIKLVRRLIACAIWLHSRTCKEKYSECEGHLQQMQNTEHEKGLFKTKNSMDS